MSDTPANPQPRRKPSEPLFTDAEEAMIAAHEDSHDPLWYMDDDAYGRKEWGVNEP